MDVHTNQIDKFGYPYILHPLRIMLKMKSKTNRIVAMLHEVVEKSDWSLKDLKEEGFSNNIINAIDCLTIRNFENEQYFDYIYRNKENKIAKVVKIEDLNDNIKALEKNRDLNKEKINQYKKSRTILLK